MTSRPRRLLIVGGGSGGHVMPGLAVVEAVRRLESDVDVSWLGARGGIEQRLVPAAGVTLHTVRAGKLNRFLGRETIPDLLRIPAGLLAALAIIRQLRPDLTLTCGGYVAVPGGLASWLCRRPLLALQQDVEPNLANRLIAPFARRIVVSFAASAIYFPPGRATTLGNPLRAAISHGDPAAARRRFGIPTDTPLTLVTGGSQGAVSLNRLVLARLPAWLERTAIIHLCGERSAPLAAEAAAGLPERLKSRYAWRTFVTDDLPHVLAAADLVVSRAGAATLAELAALGKPSILVPLPPPLGRSPQEANAALFRHAGAAVALREGDASPERLWGEAMALLADRDRRRAMGAAAAALGRRDAADAVARLALREASR